jgi:RNA polymerase sigma-70 factor (ECF subfamily)
MDINNEQALIEDARKGEAAALNALSEAARPRVRAYLLRVTMDYSLAEDLTQETLLEMVKSIEDLREPNVFWPWLYRIAMSKFQTHFRREQVRRTSERTFESRFSERLAVEQGREGLARMLKTELSQNILSAIEQLEPRDRAVLSLRCFDELGYPDIARAMETTEGNARILFFRAKTALKKELLRQGLKGSALVMALGFFGSLTETAGAGTGASAVTVSATAVKVSMSTTINAICGTNAACAILLGVLGLAGLVGSAGVLRSIHNRAESLPERAAVKSVHYVAQSRSNAPGESESLSKGAYEQWLFFPEGVDGPVFFRMQRWDPQQQIRLCAWLQNGEANYYWHSGDNVLYLTNRRTWSRSLTTIRIRRLPTDEPELTAFLDRMEGVEPKLQVHRDERTGMMAETVDYRFVDAAGFKSRYEYNTTDAALFENPWTDIPVIDERDMMRKRGWGYFTVEGEVNGQMFAGRGRMPYFYNFLAEHPAWLVIELPDGGKLVDTHGGSVVLNAAGREQARYAGGRFFTGLLRPWMGMNTIDCVRRDAARAGIEFTTIQKSNYHKTGSEEDYYADARVICTAADGERQSKIEYLVDIKNDLLKSVEVRIEGAEAEAFEARMCFTYLQSLPEVGTFETPVVEPAESGASADNGPRWLIDLARGSLQ